MFLCTFIFSAIYAVVFKMGELFVITDDMLGLCEWQS